MADKTKTSKTLLLFGGIVLAVAFLGVVFVPVTSVPLTDFEVLGGIGLVMLLIGAIMD